MSNLSRQLTIKTNVVKRLIKEVESYKQEAVTTKSVAASMEANGDDEYEVKQAMKVHADSLQMIPDSEKRLAKAREELEELVNDAEEELAATDEYKAAEALLKSVKAQ